MKMMIKLIAKIVLFPVVLLLRIVGVMADILTKLGVYVISPVVLFCLIAGVVCGINKEWTNMGLMLGFDAFLILCTFVAFLVPEAINGICNFLSDLGK